MSEKEVKVIKIALGRDKDLRKVEEELAGLLNANWRIISSGGGTGKVFTDVAGFVILERDLQPGASR